jgi:hypothetical protein
VASPALRVQPQRVLQCGSSPMHCYSSTVDLIAVGSQSG